jgi:hypothetical protein
MYLFFRGTTRLLFKTKQPWSLMEKQSMNKMESIRNRKYNQKKSTLVLQFGRYTHGTAAFSVAAANSTARANQIRVFAITPKIEETTILFEITE